MKTLKAIGARLSRSAEQLRFQIECSVDSLEDYPEKGVLWVEWRLERSESTGTSPMTSVTDHVVLWNYSFSCDCTVAVSSDTDMAVDTYLRFSVHKALKDGSTQSVGFARLNLMDFACTRACKKKSVKLLLEESHLNAKLKVSLSLRQTAGSPFFKTYRSRLS